VLAEFVVVAPIILILAMGVIEFGRAIDAMHALTGLSREGANIAARGTPLDTVLTVVMGNGGDIRLATYGGAIASEVRVSGGVPNVWAQVATSGYAGLSRVGNVGTRAVPLDSLGLLDNQTHFVVEVFYSYPGITPLKGLLGFTVPDTMYNRAVF
jgi:hypothetical protein